MGGSRNGDIWAFVVQPETSQYVDIWRIADNTKYKFFMASIETENQVCQVYGQR